jgi:6-phosphogluconolactonase
LKLCSVFASGVYQAITLAAAFRQESWVCEMGSSVVVYSYDRVTGALTPTETVSTLPAGFRGEDNSAEIQGDLSGRFLYTSNRGNDSITVFAIGPVKGTLTKVQVEPTKGNIPRNFVTDSTGKFLIVGNQKSDQMWSLPSLQKDGQLKPTGQVVNIVAPVSILFMLGQ